MNHQPRTKSLWTLLLAIASVAAFAASVTYEHDAQGRVIKATYSDGTVIEYEYDPNGNRTSSTMTAAPADTTPPSAPGMPSFSNITMTSATASWAAATDNVAVVGYDYRLNGGNWQSLGDVSSVNLGSLTAASAYTFDVRARDAATNAGTASTNNFATPDTQAPTMPTGLQAAAPSSTTVNLTWTASTDNVAVTGYKIYRNGGLLGTSGTASYADNTTAGSTAYSYRVSAYDAATNESGQSNVADVTTPDTIAPSAPTGLGATAAAYNQVNLSWNASTDTGGSGLAGYKIYRDGAFLTSITGTSHADTTVTAATAYSYTVRAYDGATNESGNSNTAAATTPPGASLSPQSLNGSRAGSGTVHTISSTTCTGVPSGGTYAWQFVSGNNTILANSASSATTSFRTTVSFPGQVKTAVYRCNYTYSGQTVPSSNTVSITLSQQEGGSE